MKHRVYKRNIFLTILSNLSSVIFTAIIIGGLLLGFRSADESSQAEGVRLLEEAILRVAVHNYAVDGQFPESLAYITEKYDIYIDRTRYIVHYDVFASNILPDIRVFELNR